MGVRARVPWMIMRNSLSVASLPDAVYINREPDPGRGKTGCVLKGQSFHLLSKTRKGRRLRTFDEGEEQKR